MKMRACFFAATFFVAISGLVGCSGAHQSALNSDTSSSPTVNVTLTSPAPGVTTTSPVSFVATATTSCSQGIASMGIYTAPNQLAYKGNGASLNHSVSLGDGTYNATVEAWDNCGGSASTPVTITVSSNGNAGGT